MKKEEDPNRRRTTWSNFLDIAARTTTENFQLAINSFSFKTTCFVFPVQLLCQAISMTFFSGYAGFFAAIRI